MAIQQIKKNDLGYRGFRWFAIRHLTQCRCYNSQNNLSTFRCEDEFGGGGLNLVKLDLSCLGVLSLYPGPQTNHSCKVSRNVALLGPSTRFTVIGKLYHLLHSRGACPLNAIALAFITTHVTERLYNEQSADQAWYTHTLFSRITLWKTSGFSSRYEWL